MKILKKQFIAIAFLLCTTHLIGENPCGTMFPIYDSTSWGIGFIRIPINNIVSLKGTSAGTQERCYIVNGEIRILNKEFPKINPYDYVYCGGTDCMLLKVYQIIDTKYQVCVRSIEGGIWLDFDEFSNDGFKFNTYLSFLNDNRNHIIFYCSSERNSYRYINIGVNQWRSCLNLRVAPSEKSAIVTCLKHNGTNQPAITHIELLGINGGWADVFVRESIFNEDENNPDGIECSTRVVNQYQGFVKVLDDNGRPNIWYAVIH